ncbi:unnamed protein product [Bursaphelenchus xylophilus]|uniref:(pine wood nematode) hypothetical protein n=1 Tax=Bursaphelenchus xylophilus TaxID=6326 RepID=A0A1I7S4C4_BURXY|nr:unnamed protein product [Bursaphelenchus xylophilus]CAG9116947.1 unnamed protein product [Bursaphelenchus xylophilus]
MAAVLSLMPEVSKNGLLQCVICGREGAGKHYGIQSCLGCKTFFRRAVIHNRRYFCENNLQCDARERKSRGPCAACRLHRCFMAGMSKEALKGKRDIIPVKTKIRRSRQASFDDKQTPSPRTTPEEHQQPVYSNNLIDPLTELDYRTRENKLLRFDSMTRARKLSCDISQSYPPFAYFTGLRIVDTVELAALASVEMYAMVEWADGLSFFHNLTVTHRAAALRRFSVFQLVIETGYCTALSSYNDAWMMPNGTCMPRDVAFLPEESQKIVNPDRAWRQEKLYHQMTNSCIDDVAMPMRRLHILPQELATLKVICFCQSCQFVCRETVEDENMIECSLAYIEEFKDKVIKDLFAFYQAQRMQNYEERFGNLLLIVSGIVSTATFLRESYQGLMDGKSTFSSFPLPQSSSGNQPFQKPSKNLRWKTGDGPPKRRTGGIRPFKPKTTNEDSVIRVDKMKILEELNDLRGSHCPKVLHKYQILVKRDELMCKLRVKNTDVKTARVLNAQCPDMCPEKERYMRELQKLLNDYECDEHGNLIPEKAVKDYARSAADQEEPLPHELRPPQVLKKTMDYLVTEFMLVPPPRSELPKWYDFLWTRTRSIRKEITQQMLCDELAVDLVEKCTRFHIFAGYAMIGFDQNTFNDRLNTENLSKCIQTLRHIYDDLAKKNIYCQSEPEFRAYDILLNLSDSNVLSIVRSYRPEVRQSEKFHLAVRLACAYQTDNYVAFFRYLKKASFLQACLIFNNLTSLRITAIRTILKTFRGKYPISTLTTNLGFVDEEECVEVATELGILDEMDNNFIKQPLGDLLDDFDPTMGKGIVQNKLDKSLAETITNGPLVVPDFPKPANSFTSDGYYENDPVLREFLEVNGFAVTGQIRRRPSEDVVDVKKQPNNAQNHGLFASLGETLRKPQLPSVFPVAKEFKDPKSVPFKSIKPSALNGVPPDPMAKSVSGMGFAQKTMSSVFGAGSSKSTDLFSEKPKDSTGGVSTSFTFTTKPLDHRNTLNLLSSTMKGNEINSNGFSFNGAPKNGTDEKNSAYKAPVFGKPALPAFPASNADVKPVGNGTNGIFQASSIPLETSKDDASVSVTLPIPKSNKDEEAEKAKKEKEERERKEKEEAERRQKEEERRRLEALEKEKLAKKLEEERKRAEERKVKLLKKQKKSRWLKLKSKSATIKENIGKKYSTTILDDCIDDFIWLAAHALREREQKLAELLQKRSLRIVKPYFKKWVDATRWSKFLNKLPQLEANSFENPKRLLPQLFNDISNQPPEKKSRKSAPLYKEIVESERMYITERRRRYCAKVAARRWMNYVKSRRFEEREPPSAPQIDLQFPAVDFNFRIRSPRKKKPITFDEVHETSFNGFNRRTPNSSFDYSVLSEIRRRQSLPNAFSTPLAPLQGRMQGMAFNADTSKHFYTCLFFGNPCTPWE